MYFPKFFIGLSLILSAQFSYSDDLTNSKKFSSFNTDSPERLLWIENQNRNVNTRISKSPNTKKLETFFRAQFDLDYTIQTTTLPDGQIFKLIDKGLGKPQLLLKETASGPEILFSSFDLAKNNSYNTISFLLNPSADKAAISFDYHGSIDGFKIVVVDLKTKKILLKNPIISMTRKDKFFFKDDNTIVVQTLEHSGKGLKAYPLDESSEPYFLYEYDEMKDQKDNWVSILTPSGLLHMVSKDQDISINGLYDIEFLGTVDNYFYFSEDQSDKDHDQTQIIRYKINDENEYNGFTVDMNLQRIVLLKKHLVAEVVTGPERFLVSYRLDDAAPMSKIKLPDCCSVESIVNDKTDNTIKLKITSELKHSITIHWDLIKNEFVEQDIINQMQTSPDLEIVTEFRMIKSFDGTDVPVKLVYKKGLELKNIPVYMESYGGFNDPAFLNPSNSTYNLDFVRHNGLYIGTGIRGGNEYGEKWHSSAILKNKTKTFEDLASIAKNLIDQGISSKEKIIISGSSNGGFVVAATGLLYPQYFGLVIPHNGVLDLLAKEELDPHFGFGWSYEYGDSRKASDYDFVKAMSPTELVNSLTNLAYTPRFLVINARNDTRVNPAHSIKFTMAMQSIPGTNCEMFSLNNSGHFNTSVRYNDYIGWRAQVIKWTTIYDFLGMTH